MDSPSKYLTVAEVAARLEVHKMSVHRLIDSGQLPAYKFGGQYRIERADFVSFVERSRTATAPS